MVAWQPVRALVFTPIWRRSNFLQLRVKESSLMTHRYMVSQDSPVLYITIVAKDRLPVFRTEEMKEVLCRAIDEARRSVIHPKMQVGE
jgi:hypothetical protein